jgi:hypothetical protein
VPDHLRLSRTREILLTGVTVYVIATAFSLVLAHVILVIQPQSDFASRIIAPVAGALGFLDAHWKAVLIAVVPFLVPLALDLVPRLRKVGSVEFDPVPLETGGVHEKPRPSALEK